MKKLFCVVLLVLFTGIKTFSQDYSLDSARIHSQGNPGDLFLSALLVTNNSSSDITLHLTRIIKNIPVNWTSCFCFPTCIAPWIDTLTFSIPAFGVDSIKPNFGTDPIDPGIGYITITLTQEGESSLSPADTIYFSGSTLSTGIHDVTEKHISIYPNPFVDGEINIQLADATNEKAEYSITNLLGQELLRNVTVIQNNSFKVNVNALVAGSYFLKIISSNQSFVSKIVKQ